MNQEKVVLNRKLFASALLNAAELLIQSHGPQGYAERLFEMFTAGGLNLGASHGSLRDWMSEQAGWSKRFSKAVELFEARKRGLDPNHPELRRLERMAKQAAADAASLRAKLNVADEKRTVFEQLREVLDASIMPLESLPFQGALVEKGQHAVDFVAALTDQHADEVIHGPSTWGLERYNYDIFCLRLERYTRLLIEYATKHLPRHKVERLHLFHMGDSLHGEIHGNKYRNHFGNTMRAAVAVADAQAEAIGWLLQHIPYVNIVGISGNHPRTTVKKDLVDPHDSFDFMVMALMAARLSNYVQEGRLDIHAPRSWSAFVNVRGKVMALNHGDDVRGTWGIPWYGFSKKEARVQALTARKDARVDFFWYGHYHTDVGVTETGARGVHSGAFTLTDAFAINAVSSGGEPMQAAMMVDDNPGMRCRLLDLPIWLRDPKIEDLYWRGRHKPQLGRSGALTVLAQADEAAGGGQFPLIRARR